MRKILLIIGFIALPLFTLSACKMQDADITRYRCNLNTFSAYFEDIGDSTNKISNMIEKASSNEENQPLLNGMEDISEELTGNSELAQSSNDDLTRAQDLQVNELDGTSVDSDDTATDTLYNLSSEILKESENYKDLINKISSAILDTETLINEYAEKKITLSMEQKIFLDQEIQKLKLLTRKLSSTTTKLSLITSNLNSQDVDMDSLAAKYLLVLDNLINNNEMLEAGLNSINMMRFISNINQGLPDGTRGKIMYGFRENDNPPITHEYYINNDGTVQEKTDEKLAEIETDRNMNENKETKSNTWLKPNIDTYYNNNLENNIDTFFNTALLDNQFMYGRNNYGIAPYMNYPYNYQMNQNARQPYTNNNNVDTMDSTQASSNTQNPDNNNQDKETKKSKKFLTKNIDTYRSQNSTTLGEKLNNFKKKITNIFNPKAENPVYQFEDNND